MWYQNIRQSIENTTFVAKTDRIYVILCNFSSIKYCQYERKICRRTLINYALTEQHRHYPWWHKVPRIFTSIYRCVKWINIISEVKLFQVVYFNYLLVYKDKSNSINKWKKNVILKPLVQLQNKNIGGFTQLLRRAWKI